MKQEDKELLLKDLCARIPYGVKIEVTWWVMGEGTCINTTLEPDLIEQLLNDEYGDTEIKPYLRSMSSMTEEEEIEYLTIDNRAYACPLDCAGILASDRIDWLNAHHFDYRSLIPKGLVIEVTKENNQYEEINL